MPPKPIKRPDGTLQRSALSMPPASVGLKPMVHTGLRLTPGRSYVLGGSLGRIFVESRLSLSPEAAVYAIRSPKGGLQALKIFDLSRTPRAAVSRAYTLQRRCRGPAVVAAVGLQVRGRFAYWLMERPRGLSLETYLSQQHSRGEQVPLRLMLLQFAQMAAAAALCHARNVVHRDLKLSNFIVALQTPADPKLTDFALAHDLHQPMGPGAGTITHMAPELLRGAPSRSTSDVWALGISLFTMVVGLEPHYADDEALVAASILADQPNFTAEDLALFVAAQRPPEAVVAGIVALYEAATQLDAEARPQAYTLVLQAQRLAALLPVPTLTAW